MSYFYVMPKGDQISLAWGDETKDTVFGGIAWSGHNADLAACQEADARTSELENRLDGERAIRDQLRNQLGERNRQVYYGVLAHRKIRQARASALDFQILSRNKYNTN